MILSDMTQHDEMSGLRKIQEGDFVAGLNFKSEKTKGHFKAWSPPNVEPVSNLHYEGEQEDEEINKNDLFEAEKDLAATILLDENIVDEEMEISSDLKRDIDIKTSQIDDDKKEKDLHQGKIYSEEEYIKYGEEQYLQGYNECKNNEEDEFNQKIEILDNIISKIQENNADVESFYEPMKSLIIKAIESIMHIELKESKRSIEKIISTILKEYDDYQLEKINLYLNPEEEIFIKRHIKNEKLNVIPDHRLEKGSVKITLGDKNIESIKNNRIDQIVQNILAPKKNL